MEKDWKKLEARSCEITNSLTLYYQNIQKQISSKDINAIANYLFPVVSIMADLITKYDSNDKPDSKFLKAVTRNLTVIIQVIKLKQFSQIKLSNEYNQFLDGIRKIMKSISRLRIKKFEDKVWKKSVEIISLITNVPKIGFWEEPVRSIFLMKRTKDDICPDVVSILTKKVHFLREYILQSQSQGTAFVWWGIIAKIILPIFIHVYPYESSCLFPQCPSPIFFDISKIIQHPNFRQNFLINSYAPIETLSLIKLLLVSFTDFPDNVDLSTVQWVFDLFCSKSSLQNEVDSFFQILGERSSESFFLVFKFLAISSTKTDNNSTQYNLLFNLLLHILPKFPDYIKNVLMIVESEISKFSPLMSIYLFIHITYYFKILDTGLWEYFKTKLTTINIDYSPIYLGFISIVSVLFYPILYQISGDSVHEHLSELSSKQQRIQNNSTNCVNQNEVTQVGFLFNDPYEYENYLNEEKKNKINITNFKKNSSLPNIILNRNGWNYEQSITYLKLLLQSYPIEDTFKAYSLLIDNINFINQIIPSRFLSNTTQIVQNLFYDLVLSLKRKPNFEIAKSLSILLTHVVTKFENDFVEKYIEMLNKMLCGVTSENISELFSTFVSSLIQFSPTSHILIPFLSTKLSLIKQKNKILIERNEFWTYILSSIAICNSNLQINLSKEFFNEMNSWDNKELITTTKAFIDSKKTSTIIPVLQSILPKNKENNISFSVFIPILFVEIYSKKSNDSSLWLKSVFQNIIENNSTRSLNKLVRSFQAFHEMYEFLHKKFDWFFDLFLKGFEKSIDFDHLDSSFWIIFFSYFDLYMKNPKLLTKYLGVVKNIFPKIPQNFKIKFMEMINTLPFSFYEENLYETSLSDQSIFLLLPNNTLFTFESAQNDTFSLHSRVPNSLFSANVTMLKSNPNKFVLNREPKMPPHIKNTENKKAPKLNFDNKLKAYFPDVNNEDEIFEELLEIEPSPIEDVKFEFEMSTENHSIYNEKTVNLANSIKALQKVPQSIDFTLLFYKMADIESCQETDERLKRKLIPVLTHIPRECLKIGIVYVKHDQFDQQEILSNTIEDSSPLFNDFLLSLGKLVNLRKHNGYDGLLDTKNCSTGTHSIYYKNNRMEIMFHVATMMPTKENDPQIIIKKRHIGNDNVQIVWCENPYGYDPSTISSHFNDAHIVIYPYDKETYKVSVYKKNAEWLIFPLPKCTIMTAEPLSALVRCTAIVADRVVRDKIEMPLLTYNNLYEQILQ